MSLLLIASRRCSLLGCVFWTLPAFAAGWDARHSDSAADPRRPCSAHPWRDPRRSPAAIKKWWPTATAVCSRQLHGPLAASAEADRIGRRWAMIIPGLLGIPVAFCYMLSGDYWVIVVGYVVHGAL